MLTATMRCEANRTLVWPKLDNDMFQDAGREGIIVPYASLGSGEGAYPKLD